MEVDMDSGARVLTVGSQKYTVVMAIDQKGAGNANHEYTVFAKETGDPLGNIKFQNGPIKESGVNGLHNEDLIAIVIDRLEGFQDGKYACNENAQAKQHLEDALHVLRLRTREREIRGVEGKSIV